MAASGWIEDRWLKKRKDPVTGKRERTDLWGTSTKRYRVCGIPGVRKRSFTTLDEAKEWKNDTIAAMKKREFVDERDGEILLGEFITQEWWPSCEYDDTTSGRMKQRIFKHIVGTALGQTQMYVIGDDHLREWKKELKSRGLADSTMELIWIHLGSIFQAAVGKRLQKNPCRAAEKNIRPRGAAHTKARAWTAEEAHAIREAMQPHYRIVADLGMLAGQRQGEAFAFSPDDIDEDRMILHVRRQLQWTHDKKAAYFKLPKGRKEREVPLSPRLLKSIRHQETAFPPVTVTLPWEGPGNSGRPTATVRLLATTHWGNRINPSAFNQHTMKPALVAAGLIKPPPDGKRWGWEPSREMMHHRWRHTYASVQLGAGEDVVSVSHWLGHASVAITLDVYTHFMPDNGQRGRTAMDSWLDGGAPDRPADLRTVDPLDSSAFTKLDLPADAVQGPTELLVSGARYGGAWAVVVQRELGGVILGEIRTEVSSDADRALASALAWVEEYCETSGLAVTEAVNLSDQFPAELRPYQVRGRFLVVPREGVS